MEPNQRVDFPGRTNSLLTLRSVVLPLLLVLIYSGARFWRLFASCLWFDELFSVHAATHPWSQLLYFAAADIIHPPLFYALLKIWIGIGGESLQWLRLLPALIAIAALFPFWRLARQLKLSVGVRNLALLFLAVSGYLIKYGQEVRMYSLLFFLSLCSLWLFFRFIDQDLNWKRQLLPITCVNLLMVYNHYAGWLLVFVETLVLIIWHRRKVIGFLGSGFLLLLVYTPWIYELYKVRQSGITGGGIKENIGWVGKPGVSDLLQYFVILNRPFLFAQSSTQIGYNLVLATLALILFAVPVILLLFKTKASDAEEKQNIRTLALLFAGPALIAFALSWMSPYSVWGTRHLVITAAPFALLAAKALVELQPNWARVTILALYGTWVFLSGAIFLFSRPPAFIWCNWEPLAKQVVVEEANSIKPINIYAYEDLIAYHLWFGLRQTPNAEYKITVIKGMPGINEDKAYFLPRAFYEVSVTKAQVPAGDKSWIAFRSSRWDETSPPLQFLKQNGFQIGQVFSLKSQGQNAYLVEIFRP